MALKVDMDKVFNKMEWSFSYQFLNVLVSTLKNDFLGVHLVLSVLALWVSFIQQSNTLGGSFIHLIYIELTSLV